jgi:hypothetical protein
VQTYDPNVDAAFEQHGSQLEDMAPCVDDSGAHDRGFPLRTVCVEGRDQVLVQGHRGLA